MQPLERTSQGIFSALTAGVSFKNPTSGTAIVSERVLCQRCSLVLTELTLFLHLSACAKMSGTVWPSNCQLTCNA